MKRESTGGAEDTKTLVAVLVLKAEQTLAMSNHIKAILVMIPTTGREIRRTV
jgi:hypothetical protein